MSKLDEIDFVEEIYPVYKAINLVSGKSTYKKQNNNRFYWGTLDFISLYD